MSYSPGSWPTSFAILYVEALHAASGMHSTKRLPRPDLLEWFADDDLQVVTRVGNTSLLTAAGIPDTDVASDHLPIVISLGHKKGAPG